MEEVVPHSLSFPSKKGWLTGLIIFGILALLNFTMIKALLSPQWNTGTLIMVILTLFCHWFLGGMYLNTKYVIRGDELVAMQGIVHATTIDIKDIGAVESNKTPWFFPSAIGWSQSSAALSIDALKIYYWGGHLIVSPKNQKSFCAALKAINPQIKMKLK